MPLPAQALRHEVTVEAYLGDGGRGPLYAAPVVVRCFLEQKTRMARTPDGRQVTSTASVYCNPGVVVTTEARITLPDGRTPTVIQVDINDTRGLVRGDHIAIRLE